MPIKRIVITIKQGPNPDNPDDHRTDRVLEFDGETKRWKDEGGEGFYPSEIKLIKGIDTARAQNPV